MENVNGKGHWHGVVLSVQPRIRLLRSFDQRQHNYLGYSLWIRGEMEDYENSDFWIGIGKVAYAKHKFHIGDRVRGVAQWVVDERKEAIQFYKVSEIEILERVDQEPPTPPPWQGDLPKLEGYRARGH